LERVDCISNRHFFFPNSSIWNPSSAPLLDALGCPYHPTDCPVNFLFQNFTFFTAECYLHSANTTVCRLLSAVCFQQSFQTAVCSLLAAEVSDCSMQSAGSRVTRLPTADFFPGFRVLQRSSSIRLPHSAVCSVVSRLQNRYSKKKTPVFHMSTAGRCS
jgi:hypothetical protein